MFLMACKGVLGPRPDAAIFADTQWELKAVYAWLDRLTVIGADHNIQIIRATVGNLRADALAFLKGSPDGKTRQGVNGRWASMPLYVLNPDGSRGMINRQCTKEYKIAVIEKEVRKLIGLRPRQRAKDVLVEQWIGISADEASRMRDSRRPYIRHHYPLIYDFDLPMTRSDCKKWLSDNGYPIPPKSACIGCPFHSDAEWRRIKADPEAWADAVEFDRAIRNHGGMRGKLFLHYSCRPLEDVDLSTAEERGQMNWIEECTGMCGL